MTDFDVVVVGSGAAGLTAALTAADSGASVLLVESEAQMGGSSALSAGDTLAAGTALQKRAGVEDSPGMLYNEYLWVNQFSIEPGVARTLAYESGPTVDWLESLGVEYLPEPLFDGLSPTPRIHRPNGWGPAVIEVLAQKARDSTEIDIALGQRVDRLVVENRVVSGVATGDDAVTASAVIVATGGFGAAPELWDEHLPSIRMSSGANTFYTGAAGARGDAFRFASQVGADLAGHDRALVLPNTDIVPRTMEVEFPAWLLIVDRAGSRRINEMGNMTEQQLVFRQHLPLFGVFDEGARLRADGAMRTSPYLSDIWSRSALDSAIERGIVRRADTLAELARQLGIDPAGLSSTVERYNGFFETGDDAEFAKNLTGASTLTEGPYYGVDLPMNHLGVTSKGLRINGAAQALSRSGSPIAGLFSAGECTGSVVGNAYAASGNSWSSCVTFGRTAGKGAATLARVVV